MKFGFSLVVRGADATPEGFAAIARRAEALGLDSLWLSSHVVLPRQERSWYGLVEGRRYPAHWREGYWTPFTVMAYLAALTERITLGTSVLVLPMHNPVEVAKQAAEVDVLSGGRLVLGVGVGWFEEEFEVLGRAFRDRGARTDDALALLRALWTEEPVTYESASHSLTDCSFLPKPVQEPGPPVWIAGGGEPAIRRAARFGDAFHPVRFTPERVREARVSLDRHCRDHGRDPAEVEIAAKLPLAVGVSNPGQDALPTQGSAAEVAEGIHRYREAGATHFVFDIVPETVAVAIEAMERFAGEVRPLL